MLRKPANCRRKTSTWCPGRCVSIAFHDLLPSSSRGPASLLCRSSASRAGAPSAVCRRSSAGAPRVSKLLACRSTFGCTSPVECRSTSRVEAPRVPKHLRLYVTGRSAGAPRVPKHLRLFVAGRSAGAPLRVPEHLRLYVAGRSAGAPSAVRRRSQCRSTSRVEAPRVPKLLACRSTFGCTSPVAVPKHLACRSTFGCTSLIAVPEHLACRSTFGCTSPVAVSEHHFACRSTSRAGALSAVRRRS